MLYTTTKAHYNTSLAIVVNAGYSSLVEWLYELHYNVYEDLHLTNWELWWGRWITGLHLFTRQQVSHKSSLFPSCHSVQATTTTLWWSSQIKSMAGNAPKSMDMDCDRNKFPPKLLLLLETRTWHWDIWMKSRFQTKEGDNYSFQKEKYSFLGD